MTPKLKIGVNIFKNVSEKLNIQAFYHLKHILFYFFCKKKIQIKVTLKRHHLLVE